MSTMSIVKRRVEVVYQHPPSPEAMSLDDELDMGTAGVPLLWQKQTHH
jgi:hypothetical protein